MSGRASSNCLQLRPQNLALEFQTEIRCQEIQVAKNTNTNAKQNIFKSHDDCHYGVWGKGGGCLGKRLVGLGGSRCGFRGWTSEGCLGGFLGCVWGCMGDIWWLSDRCLEGCLGICLGRMFWPGLCMGDVLACLGGVWGSLGDCLGDSLTI